MNRIWLALAGAMLLGVPALSVSGHAQASTPQRPRLHQITVAGLSGYIDSTGRVIIPLCFDEARRFSEGLAAVQMRGQWGYIDTLGSFVIPPQFDYGADFSEGLAWVQSLGADGGRWYIDRTGRALFGSKFDIGGAADFSNGRASVSIRGVPGYIDHTGTMVIRSKSESYHPQFSDGLAAMEVGGKWGFIDTTGTMVIKPQFPRDDRTAFGPGTGFRNGFAAVPMGGKWGYIEKTGRVVIPAQFEEAWSFNDGLARVRVGTRWGYIDTTGAFVIAPQYANTQGFSDGLAAVRVGPKWGYIDRTGGLVIPPQFESIDPRWDYVGGFAGGIARARRGDEDGYIDRTGRFVWTSRGADPGAAGSSCAAALAQQPALAPQPNVDTAALPAVSPLPQPSGSVPQTDSARAILYYEDLDGEVLTGLFLDGRRIAVSARPAVTMPMWSPDGAWVAYGTRDSATQAGVLAVVNLQGVRRNLFVARDSVPVHPRWSPDGRFRATILVGTRDTTSEPETVPLVVIGVADAAVRSRIAIPVAAVAARVQQPKVRWSPDGQRILVAGEMAVVVTIGTGVIDTISRQPVTAEWGAPDAVYYFAQSDSGRPANPQTLGAFFRRRLADREPTLLASADRVAKLGAPDLFVPLSRRVVLSPDGRRLALWGRLSGASSDLVWLYDVPTESVIDLEKPTATFRQEGLIIGLQWGPQGRGLAALVSAKQGLEIQYLDVGLGKWRKLATVRAGGAADYYGFGILSLSWTQ